jgi:hypothetical protein
MYPIGELLNRKAPRASVSDCREIPVSVFNAVTLTAGIAAELGSVTFPVSDP